MQPTSPEEAQYTVPGVLQPEFQHHRQFKEQLLPARERVGVMGEVGDLFGRTEKYIHRVRKQLSSSARLLETYNEYSRLDDQWRTLEKSNDEVKKSEVGPQRLAYLSQLKALISSEHDYYFRMLKRVSGFEPGDGGELSPESQQCWDKLKDGVLEETIDFLGAKQNLGGGGYDGETHVARVVDLAVDKSDRLKLSGLQQYPKLAEMERPKESLKVIRAVSEASLEVLRLVPNFKEDEFRHWLKESQQKIAEGMKIIATPHYADLIKQIQEIGDRENGIGGRLYYGPPGTGKTELAVMVNLLEGFKTRVVSMHYWTDFNTFLGEAPVPVGLDKKTGFMERLSMARDRFGKMTDSEFRGVVNSLWQQAKNSGRSNAPISEWDYIKHFTVGVEGDNPFWHEIKQGFINYLDKQMLAVTTGMADGEDEVLQWVKGEIQIAAESGQRLLIDEIDKAGPNSMAGLSRILAMSSDQIIELRGQSIRLPSWFKIDATSNDMVLAGKNETGSGIDITKSFMYDRFNHVYMDYPPTKDLMMLAAVWSSNEEGEIQLNATEQEQLLVVFEKIIAEVQDLYKTGVLAQPLTMRGMKELVGYLVDPLTHQRKDATVKEAVERVLLWNRQYGVAKEGETSRPAREVFDEILGKYQSELQEPIRGVMSLEQLHKRIKIQPIDKKRGEFLDHLESVRAAPMIKRLVSDRGKAEELRDLLVEGEFYRMGKLSFCRVNLDIDQKTIVGRAIEAIEKHRADKARFIEEVKKGLKGQYNALDDESGVEVLVGEDAQSKNTGVWVNRLLGDGKATELAVFDLDTPQETIIDFDEDLGQWLMTRTKSSLAIELSRLENRNYEGNKNVISLPQDDFDACVVKAGPMGTEIVIFRPQQALTESVNAEGGKYNFKIMAHTGSKTCEFSYPGLISSYQFSEDGRLLLLETPLGGVIIDYVRSVNEAKGGASRFKVISQTGGRGYRFAGNKLIVSSNLNDALIAFEN